MKTITINAYSFNELSEEAQQKAINHNRDYNIEYEDWYEFVYEEFKKQAIKEGFDIDRMYFSGFWSQGDGAMFEYTSLNDKLLEDFISTLHLSEMRKNWIRSNIYISGKGNHRGNYYHEGSCNHNIHWEVGNGDLHWSTNFYQWLESFSDDFEDFVVDRYNDLCHSLYNSLEAEYEGLTSDESIKEILILNEYNFDLEGNII
jgi:hypothetical protein